MPQRRYVNIHHKITQSDFRDSWENASIRWPRQWLALGCLRCRDRDTWIGWTEDQRRRLHFVANHARFLILSDAHRVAVVLGETFIDPTRESGTVFWVTNWQDVGTTLGFGRHNGTYQVARSDQARGVTPVTPVGAHLA